MFAEHDFAVFKFEGVRVAGLGDGMDFRPRGELIENRVQMRITKAAQISDAQSETGQGIGHDRSVAAQFG